MIIFPGHWKVFQDLLQSNTENLFREISYHKILSYLSLGYAWHVYVVSLQVLGCHECFLRNSLGQKSFF